MKNLFLVISLCFALIGPPVLADVYYIGFNKLNNLEKDGKQFDNYIQKLKPIMARYDMPLSVFDVAYAGKGGYPSDIVTFGQAPDMETLQKMFADPDFHAIFPMLVEIVAQHHVVFTQGSAEPQSNKKVHQLLSLNWFKEQKSQTNVDIQLINQSISDRQKQFGVRLLRETSAMMAQQGLAGELVQLPPPDRIELWQMRDAHGYLEHAEVVNANKEMRQHLASDAEFWLVPR